MPNRDYSRFELAAIFDSSHAAIIGKDLQGNVTNWNRAATGIFGYTPADMIGYSITKIIPQELLDTEDEILAKVGSGETIDNYNTVRLRKDGSRVAISLTVSPILNDRAEIIGISSIASDITQREQDRAALHESERQFRTLADSIPQLAWMANPDGSVIWYNRRWREYTGIDVSQVQGPAWQRVISAEELPLVIERMQRSIDSSEMFEMVVSLLGTDGVFRPFLSRCTPLRNVDGEVVRWFGTSTDISEQKRVEQALRESEDRFRKAFHLSPFGSFISRKSDGQILECNETFCEISGHTREQLLGQTTTALGLIDLETRQKLLGLLASGSATSELSAHTKNGVRHLILAIENIISDGEPYHLWCVVDITKRKEAEFRLTRLNRLHTMATEMSAAVGRIQDRQQLLQAACQIAVQHTDLPMVFVAELDPVTRLARPVTYAGTPGHSLDNWCVNPLEGETSQGTTGTAIREDRYNFCNDLATDPRLAPWCQPALNEGFGSCASFPLRENGRTIGALNFMAAECDYFQNDELKLMMSVTDNVSLGLDALLLNQKKVMSERMQHAAYAISTARGKTNSLTDFYSEVHRIICDIMPARNFYIALKDGASDSLSYPYWVDERLPEHPGSRIGKGLTAYVLRTGRSLLCTPQMEDELVARGEVVKHAKAAIWLGVPLRVNGTTLGVMAVQDYNDPSAYGASQLEMLEYVSAQLASAIGKKGLEEVAELQSKVMDATSNAIIITNRKGEITWVNPAFSVLTGYTFDEVVGKNPRFLKSGEQKPEFYHQMWEMLLGGKVWTGTLVNRKKNGDRYSESATITPVLDKDGQISHFVAVKSDITEALSLEEQFRKAQRMEAIGRLSAGVAHDFNNHLAVILGFTELLEDQMQAQRGSEEKLGQIRRAANRAADLTRQLLAFSRQQVLQPVVLDLNATIRETEKMLRRLITEDIQLVTQLHQDLGKIRADRTQIDQVLMNLAVNAKDAMPQGGRLIIETSNVELDEPYAQMHFPAKAGSYVMLAVSDNGIGMNDEIKGRIFEPFFTTKELGKGTGLGLSTVYGIVKQSGGWIWVYSEPGKGTAFKIYLPRVLSTPAPPVPENNVHGAMGRGETLLVVEDTMELLNVLREILQKAGYNVLCSTTPLAALKMLESAPIYPALLITDIVLPEISGREMADRAVALLPSLKVMYMSGYTDDTILRQNIQNLNQTFLQKPFKSSEVLNKVRSLLDQERSAYQN